MTTILNISAVTKTYGDEFTLGPIDMQLEAGACLALLGKNGAGKSTLFGVITGSHDATDGEVRFQGLRMVPEAAELKRQMGYLPQNLLLPRWVTGKELLLYAAKLHAHANPGEIVDKTMKFWDCDWFAKRPLATCSHGMQKRVALSLATMHQPKLLILDEPFSGLDIFHIEALNQTIEQRQQAGLATIVCTHIAPYAAKLCTSACVLENGKMDHLPNWGSADYLARVEQVEQHFFPKA